MGSTTAQLAVNGRNLANNGQILDVVRVASLAGFVMRVFRLTVTTISQSSVALLVETKAILRRSARVREEVKIQRRKKCGRHIVNVRRKHLQQKAKEAKANIRNVKANILKVKARKEERKVKTEKVNN